MWARSFALPTKTRALPAHHLNGVNNEDPPPPRVRNPVCRSLKATLGQYGKVAQFVGSHNVQAVTAVTGATKNPRYPLPLSYYRHTEEDVRVFPS
jgi:hypothetical protein